MNLEAYHRAWMQGFSEKECCMRAEDVWEQEQYDKLEQERLDREYEQEYYAELERQYLEEMK
jgi:hypothetical protein